MINYIISAFLTLAFFVIGFLSVISGNTLNVTYMLLVLVLLFLFNTFHLHMHHQHLFSKQLPHVWRMNIYSIILPFLLWVSTLILFDWFYGVQRWTMIIIAIITFYCISLIQEQVFKELKLKGKMLSYMQLVSKTIVFFYVMLCAYGLAYLFESHFVLNAMQLFWIIFALCYVLMWQEHHKHYKHSLQYASILALAAWCVAIYGYVIYYIHLPHIAGALMITMCYALLWSIFSLYVKKLLTREKLFDSLALFIFTNVIILTAINFGQII